MVELRGGVRRFSEGPGCRGGAEGCAAEAVAVIVNHITLQGSRPASVCIQAQMIEQVCEAD